MIQHIDIEEKVLRSLIKQGKIKFGGNRRLNIYGMLHCRSGKKMNKGNRVFFNSEEDAQQHGYRLCGHCMKQLYIKWKHGFI